MTETNDLLPEGFADRLPAAATATTRVMRDALRVMDSHGYDRVIPPLAEFEQSLATRMEGVGTERMIRFTDPASLRTMALRSDITVQVGRIAATRMADAPRPLRLCYSGEVATLDGRQLDPRRQKLQLGAELVGSDTVAAASEIVALAVETLQAAGAEGLTVDFTLPDLVDTLAQDGLPLPADRIEAVRRELDTKDAGGLRDVGGEAYLPLIHAGGPFADAIETLAGIDAGGALATRIAGLKEIAARIDGEARLTLDPSERHGFEYQSWFGFSIYADGMPGTLARGGTYRIRGLDEPATGFSFYPDRLIDALAETGEAAPVVFLPPGHDGEAAARLRAEGWRTRAALTGSDDAAALGCTHVLEGDEAKPL
ncbi:ATP phosphoribosyltransferase regulatory subunit [Alteriqipengyuania flavescens]|uniref:ATP phosphoribosyltransferase regulatory subunit n=1 Tax=Alteriqipengyuania flavescens TaxID=3053610 RepID=UPI0025B3F50A|nr:ATP phosphoribosyltransferase regulatory subunit [Alteriqipengyuania flavescens]WJY17869.1 ATP phosphoribosyltransferase regulatory subunit [Alteriqipengyuania flavescens]WJY23810.1 ATP phosphoribosyltransferase regulatory subunit [Alteriqipengyuania flavescens]